MKKQIQANTPLLLIVIASLLCVSGTARLSAQTIIPEGALPGLFSISISTKVGFSQGNLQYKASNHTWRFAINQYDYIGSANSNVSSSYSGYIDIFCWGTSGYNHGAVCYQPWSYTKPNSNYYAYGSSSYNLYNQSGKADWGYNAISNGGNTENIGWHTLKNSEWNYIFNNRNTASGIRYAKAKVVGVNGIILLPDDWSVSYYTLSNTNTGDASYSSNTITASQWVTLEQHGAVFLPAAGCRSGDETTIYDAGTRGAYWSSSVVTQQARSGNVLFYSSEVLPNYSCYRYEGGSVRLVCPAGNYSFIINALPNPSEGGTVSGDGTYNYGSSCTLTATPAEGYVFANWTEDGIVVSTNATYTFTVLKPRNLVANYFEDVNVAFADANVKTLCIANWDMDGDGELSYDEADSVTSLDTVFQGKTNITSFDELRYFTGLASIGDNVFNGCSGLTSVIIPNSVTSIGSSAFYGCSGLTGTLAIPNSVTSIGNSAFSGCSGLTSVTIPNSVTSIGSSAFYGCSGLTGTLVIPNSVTSIDNSTFEGCSGLTGILAIPNSITSIGSYAFKGCSGLNSVTIPNSVTLIGSSAFDGCSGLTGILTIPNSVISIDNSAFNGCSGLTYVTIPNSVTSISNSSFNGCSGLISVAIPNSVTSIGSYAFKGCSRLTSVTIPTSVTSIGSYAFNGCSGLTALTIPNSVTSIGFSAFNGCSGLEQIMVVSENTTYDSRENCNAIIKTNTNELILGCKNTIIPNSVTSIGSGSFWNCSGLTSVTIPNSVTSIGHSAFFGCGGLTSLYYTGDVAQWCSIGFGSAYSNPLFYAHYLYIDNEPVTNLVIPNSVTSIGNYAFYLCRGLTSITVIAETPPTINSYTFYGISNTIPVNVPYNSSVVYQATSGWSDFTNYIEINIDVSFAVSVTANPSNGGTMSGSGTYYDGQSCTVTATPNEGYSFANWTEDGEVVSTNASYTFTVNNERNLTANFTLNSHTVTVTANPSNGGTVNGSGNYNYGSTCTVMATPNAGCSFINWTENGVVVSANASYTFTVTGNRNLVANFFDSHFNVPTGAINGLFSVSEYSKVAFSQGNLQYQASTNTWRFATNQWDIMANYNANISQTYSGWIDLFGWGTSGYNHGAVCYQPWSTSQNGADYLAYGWGIYSLPEQTGQADWGYNAILNGGNQENSGWQTLDYTNWDYLLETRNTPSGIRYALASVNNSCGMILLPDDWNANYYVLNDPNNPDADFHDNSITAEQWTTLEQHGAVFLPAAGYRVGTSYNFSSYDSYNRLKYWTSTGTGITDPQGNYNWSIYMGPGANTTGHHYYSTNFWYENKANGYAVRLVHFVDCYSVIEAVPSPWEGGTVSGTGVYQSYNTCTLIATPNPGYTFMYWTENGVQVSSNVTYSFRVTNNNRNLVAHFSAPLTITTSSNFSEGGVTLGDGVFDYGTACTLTAIANPGYTFIKWTKNGEDVYYLPSYSFSVTENANYVAVFEETPGIVVGVSESTNGYLPSCSYPKYSLSQQIYTPEEIGGDTIITNLSFFNTGRQINYLNYDIYMVHTDKTAFNSNTDWITVSESDRVFSGYVNMVTGYWTTIELDTPFIYDGTSNLAVVIDDNKIGYSSGMSCRVFNTQGNQAICINSYETNYNPQNPSGYTGTRYSEKNQIVFQMSSTFDISATAEPAEGGTVTGAGTYQEGNTCTLTATANPGYSFANWTRDGTVVSTEASYTFTVTSNASYVANFTLNSYEITTAAEPEEGGMVTGAGPYLEGASCTLTATANTGYSFVNWTQDGTVVSTEASYTFTVTSDASYVANFTLNSYEITTAAVPEEGGTVTGAGIYNYGSTATLTATANPGYEFDHWGPGYEFQYFTIESLEDGNAITLTIGSAVTQAQMQSISYSTDNGATWNTTTIDDTEQVITVNLNAGEKVLWKGLGTNMASSYQEASQWSVFSGTRQHIVYGNIASLLFGDDFVGQTALSKGRTYQRLFSDDSNLVAAEHLILPFTDLQVECYGNLFQGCSSLVSAPKLPAVVIKSYCYQAMFSGCSSLLAAPELPAKTLQSYCYNGMFRNCASLVNAPELPATTLAIYCYTNMFNGCSSLLVAPDLPAQELKNSCYGNMFYNCSSLVSAPAILGTTVEAACCQSMFTNCTLLTKAPILPATTLVTNCYQNMFYNCSSVNEITVLATDISATNCTTNWLKNVSSTGTFYKAPGMEGWTTGASGIPSGWAVVNNTTDYTTPFEEQYFTIESLEDGNTITLTIGSAVTQAQMQSISYSTDDGANWTETLIDDTEQIISVNLNANEKVLWKGSGLTLASGWSNNTECSRFGAEKAHTVRGNAASLLFGDDFVGQTELPVTPNEGRNYQKMFFEDTSLVSARHLVFPFLTLQDNCYNRMFYGCTSLRDVPALPALEMTNFCYRYMFAGCSSLANAPILPATTLATYCYENMFNGCTSLVVAPELPATTLNERCYSQMFDGCTSLSQAPILPALTLVERCYYYMFRNCSLVNEVTCLATDISAPYCTLNWLNNVATAGTFNKAPGMEDWTAGASGIPEGWIVTANEPAIPSINLNEPTISFEVMEPGLYVAYFKPIMATQTSMLAQGWNWWAPTVQVTAAQLQETIGNKLVQIKAKNGVLGDNVVPGEMYRIKTTAPCEVSLTGLTITPVEVSLAPGTNWFGSICIEEKTIGEAISVEATAGDKIVSQSGGFAIYNGTAWEGTLTTLQPNQGYVYVTTESKTLIEESVGTTVNMPTVTTDEVSNVTQNTATCGGNVTDDGGGEVTERGICWGTSHNPTVSVSHGHSGTGIGSFTVNLTGLIANTTYYVRAYATNSAGTAYGSEVSFTTSQIVTAPTVTTNQVTNITQTTATCGGNVTADGGGTVTARGVCWSTSQNPTVSGSHTTNGTGTGSFTSSMTGLTANTTYYVRAYATNSAGTAYGSEVSFTTSQNITAPTVTTSQVTNITQTTATGGGNVANSGNATVTARGICWSTSHNPTVSGSHTTNGTGTGSFTSSLTGLTANTTYYVRAYATNSAGTAYGSEVSFTTSQIVTAPTVTTSQVTNITQTTTTCGGNVTADGGGTVTARGVCWSTSQNPTVSGSHTTNGTGTGSFTSSITGLTANTTYYVRAYATNSAGTAYGTQRSFTTTQNITQLTVFDGTVTDERIPVVGWVQNQYTKSEYVMPASYLTSMNGKTITSMACYSNNTSVNYSATFKVFLKEVNSSTISNFQGYSSATIVHEGSLTVTNGIMTIEFTTPFTYNGGNLLIGFYNISPVTSQLYNKRFYGVTSSGSSIVGWNQNSLNNITSPGEYPNFLPKTTFYFSN